MAQAHSIKGDVALCGMLELMVRTQSPGQHFECPCQPPFPAMHDMFLWIKLPGSIMRGGSVTLLQAL